MPRPDPLYQNLLVQLRNLILKSYAPGERLPSQRALADMHGVGQTTTHRALGALEREGLIEVRSRFYWQRSLQKRSGKKDRRNVKPVRVAVITRRNQNEINNTWTYQLLQREIKERGWELVWVPNPKQHHPTPGRNAIDLRCVPWNDFDVAILFEIEDAQTLSSPILKKHRVLAIDLDATPFGIESVSFDDHGAGRWAARYLFDMGHRRFAMTDEVNEPGWAADMACMHRSHGFQAEIGRLGGCIRPEYRIPTSRKGIGEWKDTDSGPRAIEKWMAFPPKLRPTALFAINMSPVSRLLNAMQKYGLSMPEDLSIITATWHDSPTLDGLKLTHIFVDFRRLVRRSLDTVAGIAFNSGCEQKPTLHVEPILLVPGDTTVSRESRR